MGEAAGDQDGRPGALAERELAGEARLADPGFPDDGDDAAAAGLARRGEQAAEALELSVAADERRIQAPFRLDEGRGPLVEPDPADASELDGTVDDGAGAVDDLAGGDAGREAEVAGGEDGADGVVVRGGLGAEDGDESLGTEALERCRRGGRAPRGRL